MDYDMITLSVSCWFKCKHQPVLLTLTQQAATADLRVHSSQHAQATVVCPCEKRLLC